MTRTLSLCTLLSSLWLLLAPVCPLAYTGMPGGDEDPPQANAAFEQELVGLINAARDAEGLAPLRRIDCLNRSARYHAVDQRDDEYFAHPTYDAGGVYVCALEARLAAFYPELLVWGEIIGVSYATPQAMFDAWMASEPHRQVMLHASFREIGVGFCTGGAYSRYWVVDFGMTSESYPVVINLDEALTESPAVSLYIYGEGVWTEMRIRNDGDYWSDWIPFASEVDWELRHETGTREVFVQMRNVSDSAESSDTIELDMSADVPGPAESPETSWLEPGRPNPFHAAVRLEYLLPAAQNVRLRIHDASGRLVATLEEGVQGAGRHVATWNGADLAGHQAPAGIYFGVLQTESEESRRTLILVR